MWKLIFWGIVIWAIIQVVKRTIASKQIKSQALEKEVNANIENMVECEQCHVHLPRSEAFLVEGKFYCTQSHIKSGS